MTVMMRLRREISGTWTCSIWLPTSTCPRAHTDGRTEIPTHRDAHVPVGTPDWPFGGHQRMATASQARRIHAHADGPHTRRTCTVTVVTPEDEDEGPAPSPSEIDASGWGRRRRALCCQGRPASWCLLLLLLLLPGHRWGAAGTAKRVPAYDGRAHARERRCRVAMC